MVSVFLSSSELEKFIEDYRGERAGDGFYIVNVSEILNDLVIENLGDSYDESDGLVSFGILNVVDEGDGYRLKGIQIMCDDYDLDVIFVGYLKRVLIDHLRGAGERLN